LEAVLKVGIPTEVENGERRVATSPEAVVRLTELGFEVAVQSGAGDGCGMPDTMLAEAGAEIVPDAATLWASADLVIKVNPPTEAEVDLLSDGGQLISLIFPGQNEALVGKLGDRNATVIALDCIPRISRAQKMDVLSSMANISGYRAVLEAANVYPRYFMPQITAAGKTPPAKVLIIGVGVAGLSAIGAARGLGGEVRAFDTRLATREQVQSMGAAFLELDFDEDGDGGGGYGKVMSKEFIDAEMALFAEQAKDVDIIITTALIPGRKAPILITKEMVDSMKPGSVIVDLAAANGGNCEYTVPGEIATVADGRVKIIGYTDLTSRLPSHASRFFSSNVVHLLDDMVGEEGFRIDEEDEVVRGALVLRDGEMKWPPPAVAPPEPPAAQADESSVEKAGEKLPAPVESNSVAASKKETPAASSAGRNIATAVAAVALALLGMYAPTDFLQHFTVFVLAVFVGWQVVWSVTAALHTPLMSVTNAISGIIIVGGLLQAGSGELDLAGILGALAILFASINVVGGFAVTRRMLEMFKPRSST
jgi:NAD(P) transhydrogenase subunit alpha